MEHQLSMQLLELSDIENYSTNPQCALIPLFGSIPCGIKNFLDSDIRGYIEIPKAFIGSGDYFVLRAKGDSMIEAGILDGSLVIIRKQDYADEGQIAVAYIDDEVTLKYFRYNSEKHVGEFIPANNRYLPVEAKEYKILGIAVKIIKDL